MSECDNDGWDLQSVESALPLGSIWQHNKTENMYRVIGYAFDGDRDLWTVLYMRGFELDSTIYSRSYDNFTTPGRFTRVDNES